MHSSAAELGHTVIELGGPACDCGRRGCGEAAHTAALAAGDRARAAAAVALGVGNAVQVADVSRVALGGYRLRGHAQMYLDAVHSQLASTFIARSGGQIDVSVDEDLSVATGAAVAVLDAFYGRPAPVAGAH